MNTLPPPEWLIIFEDGSLYGSNEGPWSQVAHLVSIDGLMVYVTTKPVQEVHVLFPGHVEVFRPPTPRPCFAYKRLAHCLSSEGVEGSVPDWLYTCFGYCDERSRVTLLASPYDVVHSSSLRSTPFTP